MKEIYKEAFSEVDAILKLMPESLLNKIPEGFKQIVKNEKATDYNPIINEPIEEFKLKEETLIILSLIYRDFLCDQEEREKLRLRDAQMLKEAEKEIEEKYNPDNLFKNRPRPKIEEQTEVVKEENEEKNLMVMQEEKWYKKIFNLIKNFFYKVKK